MTESQYIGKNVKVNYLKGCEVIGVSYQYLYKIFNNKNVDSDYLIQLSKILNVPISVFFGEQENRSNAELLETIDKLNETIRSLKYKLFITQTTCSNIQGFYSRKFRGIDESLIKQITENNNFQLVDELTKAALEVIQKIESDPDKLKDYQELLKKVAPLYDPSDIERTFDITMKHPDKEIILTSPERDNSNTLAFIDKDKKTKYKIVRGSRGKSQTKNKPI